MTQAERRLRYAATFYAWLGIIITIFMLALSGCCYAQLMNMLPDQIYYANDSCEYYLPDYTSVVEAVDNCEVEYFYQYPESGTVLTVGTVTEVRMVAGDASGNERTLRFNVVVVDTLPPVFNVDTVLLNSLGQYQNEYRTWHLYNWVTARGDTLQDPEGFGLWGYYTARSAASITVPTCSAERMRWVPYDSLPPGHPLLAGMPVVQDAHREKDSLSYPTFSSPGHLKRSYFVASGTYAVEWVDLYVRKRGDPAGDLEVWLLEVGASELAVDTIAGGRVPLAGVLEEPHNHWVTVRLTPAVVKAGRLYALHAAAPQTTGDDEAVWITNRAPQEDRFLRYTYTGGDTWGRNPYACYMFKLYGVTQQTAGI